MHGTTVKIPWELFHACDVQDLHLNDNDATAHSNSSYTVQPKNTANCKQFVVVSDRLHRDTVAVCPFQEQPTARMSSTMSRSAISCMEKWVSFSGWWRGFPTRVRGGLLLDGRASTVLSSLVHFSSSNAVNVRSLIVYFNFYDLYVKV